MSSNHLNNNSIIGHNVASDILSKSLKNDTINGSWLISGLKGIGKASLTLEFARQILPQIGSNDHPDLTLIQPTNIDENGKEKAIFEIRIYQIRQMSQKLSQTSAAGNKRIVVIDAIDEMNQNAANALLKILEEPPKDTIIFLISHCIGRVLATIRSRCRIVSLHPLQEKEIQSIIENNSDLLGDIINQDDAEFASHVSGGSVGNALEIYNNNGLALYKSLLEIIDNFPDINYTAMRDLSAQLSLKDNNAQYQLFINMLEWFIYSVVNNKANNRDLYNFSGKDQEIRDKIAKEASIIFLTDSYSKIQKINNDSIKLNMDKSATIENIFYSFQP